MASFFFFFKCLILLNIQPHIRSNMPFLWQTMPEYLDICCNAEKCPAVSWCRSAGRHIMQNNDKLQNPPQNRTVTSAKNSWERLRWKNVVLRPQPGTCCTSPKNVNVHKAVFLVPSLSLPDYACRKCWLNFCLHILCLFCSERWVTSNTFKHPHLFSSGSKNKMEKKCARSVSVF